MLLREKDRNSLIELLSALNLHIEVWAYGSRVNGTAHEGSDLDLVIRTKDLSPVPFTKLSLIRELIRHSNIPILVEIRDWATLPDYFHENISANYEVLFKNF